MKTRFIKEIGTRIYLRIFCFSSDLPKGECSHDAKIFVKDILHDLHKGDHPHYGGEKEDYPDILWPVKCDTCGKPFSEVKHQRQVHDVRLYNTPSGKPEPGDLYYIDWLPESMYFDNHKGGHLLCVLPNGWEWNIDSRASNCGSPDDRLHRCWVKHGSPEDGTIHVDKNGLTCSAGAGSIQGGNWHGFLHNNNLE